jgi:hypothetical protein
VVCAAVTDVVTTVAAATFFFTALTVGFFFAVVGFAVVGFATAGFTAIAGRTVAQEPPGRTLVFAQVGAAARTEEELAGCTAALATLTAGGAVPVDATGSDGCVPPEAAALLMPAANALITSMEPMLAAAVMRVARWNSCCDRSTAPW